MEELVLEVAEDRLGRRVVQAAVLAGHALDDAHPQRYAPVVLVLPPQSERMTGLVPSGMAANSMLGIFCCWAMFGVTGPSRTRAAGASRKGRPGPRTVQLHVVARGLEAGKQVPTPSETPKSGGSSCRGLFVQRCPKSLLFVGGLF